MSADRHNVYVRSIVRRNGAGSVKSTTEDRKTFGTWDVHGTNGTFYYFPGTSYMIDGLGSCVLATIKSCPRYLVT